MAASRKSPGDATGRKAEELAEARAEALRAREGEISLITPVPEVIDMTIPKEPDPDKPLESGIVTTSTVEVKSSAKVKMRVNTDLDEVTIGRGNNYNFKRGQTYLVTKHVYDHLEEKGYVYH